MKKVKKIKLRIVIFTAVKNRCILHGRVFVMLPKDQTIQNKFIFTAADFVSCGNHKSLPVHHDNADYISGLLGSLDSFGARC